MKIPGGYGYVNLIVDDSVLPDGITEEDFEFLALAGSVIQPEEISVTYETVNHNFVKKIIGYHINYELQLIDYGLGDSSQDRLTKFLYHYKLNTADDKWIYITPRSSDSDYFWGSPAATLQTYRIIIDTPEIVDIEGTNRKIGQIMKIKGQTKAMIPVDEWKQTIIRDTSGAWMGYGWRSVGATVQQGIPTGIAN